ncbi:MAG: hypothetical protein WC969_13980 [Elusimicrobiota bacterium]|jgi:hypothetical protein
MRTLFAALLTLSLTSALVGAQSTLPGKDAPGKVESPVVSAPAPAPAPAPPAAVPVRAEGAVKVDESWHDAQASAMGGPAKGPAAPAPTAEPSKTPDAVAVPAPPPPPLPAGFFPPSLPKHERRELSTAAEIALDLAEVVAFLEGGQSYFRTYQKGTHTSEENTRFLRFLEDYERERLIAQKEAETLRQWMREKSDLEAPEPPKLP